MIPFLIGALTSALIGGIHHHFQSVEREEEHLHHLAEYKRRAFADGYETGARDATKPTPNPRRSTALHCFAPLALLTLPGERLLVVIGLITTWLIGGLIAYALSKHCSDRR